MHSSTLDTSAGMAAAAGMFAIFGVVALIGIAFSVLLHWRIAAKAGYPGALSLLLLIPLVNVVVYILFAFSEWPIEVALRAGAAGGPGSGYPPQPPPYVPPGGGGYVAPPASYFPPASTPPAIPPEA